MANRFYCWAGKEIIEFLDMTCGYLLKNEPDLKKEVREIMRPVLMTQMGRAEYEINLVKQRNEEDKNRLGDAIRKLI